MIPSTTFSSFDSHVVIDLLELSQEDPAFLQTQYDNFFCISEKICQKIHIAYAKYHWADVQFQAHALASSASILGAVNLRKLCLSIEEEAGILSIDSKRDAEKIAGLIRYLSREVEAQRFNFDLDLLRTVLRGA